MKKFWQEVLTLPYTENLNNSKHENQIKSLLEKHGFTIITKKEFVKLYEGNWDLLPEHYGVEQPFGSQQSPDFRVKHNSKLVDIECKSNNKSAFPVYNTGLPKPDVFYIFTCGKYNATTIYISNDVVMKRKRELYACLIDELNAILRKYQAMPEWQDDDRGFDFYIRNMFKQTGKWTRTDYFKHKDRQLCESNVLNYNW